MANSRKRGVQVLSEREARQRSAAKRDVDYQKKRDDASVVLLDAAWNALQCGDLTRMLHMIVAIAGMNQGTWPNQILEEAGLKPSEYSGTYRYFSNITWWAMGILDMATTDNTTEEAIEEHKAIEKAYKKAKAEPPKRIGMLYEDDTQLLWGFQSFTPEFLRLRREAKAAIGVEQLQAVCKDHGVYFHSNDTEKQLQDRVRNHVQWSFMTSAEKQALTGTKNTDGTTGAGVTGSERNAMLEVE